MKTIQTAKKTYIFSSAAFCAAGIFLLFQPGLNSSAFCTLLGLLYLLCGAAKLLGYFSKDTYQLAFQFDLAFGLLAVLVGLVVLLHRNNVILLLDFAVGVVALADALLKVQTAIDARRFGLKEWALIAAAAALTNLSGLVLIFRAFRSADGSALLALAGATLLLEGILNLCVAVFAIQKGGAGAAKSACKRQSCGQGEERSRIDEE